jgi:large subunit ribosomal protein L33
VLTLKLTFALDFFLQLQQQVWFLKANAIALVVGQTGLTPRSSIIMHATTLLHMARGKGKTLPIKMISSAGTGYFYTTRKNVSRTPEKINLLKYDPVVRRRVIFKEGKIK